ncbi:MAG: GNAT family N-acetyltransferase [Clostridiales bacterium]|nr:GNAT family N-acetyltransferase [Clostridiales bacterium]
MIKKLDTNAYLHNEFGLIVPFSVVGFLDQPFEIQVFDHCAGLLHREMDLLQEADKGDYLSDAFYERVNRCLCHEVKKLGYTPDYAYTHGYMMNFMAEKALCTHRLQDTTKQLDDLADYHDATESEFHTDSFPVFATLADKTLLSVCGVNEFTGDFSDGTAEIAVATAPEARGRGYALSNVIAMTNFLLKQGFRVVYQCFCDNEPSAKLALRAGFRLVSRDYHYVCYENECESLNE